MSNVLGSLFLALIVFSAGCIIPFDFGGNGKGNNSPPIITDRPTVDDLKDPSVVSQKALSETELATEFDNNDEIFTMLDGAKGLGFDNFLGASKSDFADGNTVTVAMLANSDGKVIFVERFSSPKFNKSILVQYNDQEHYTIFDSTGGIKRDGAQFFRLTQDEIQSKQFLDGPSKNTASAEVAAFPVVANFGYCDEEKGGGFWDCILDHKGELGISLILAIATCIGTGVGTAANAFVAGLATPAQIKLLLECIGSVGTMGVIIYGCTDKLIDNAPVISSYSQITGSCYSCNGDVRKKMSEVTMKATVEDDRLPDPEWLTPIEVKKCGKETERFDFKATDCGGNIVTKEESMTVPPGENALVQCIAGDNCCPTGCNSNTDSDCFQTCGNGTVEGKEECDGSDFKNKSCQSYGYPRGQLECLDCLIYFANCYECKTAADCSDGVSCTTDECVDFACRHTAISGCCTSTSQCNDSDACTTDSCGESHACSNTPLSYGPTPNTPQQGSSCADCAALGRECKQDLYSSGSSSCCPQGYCLADSYCHPQCTIVGTKTCKNGSWQ